jgi:hypothetical protein
MDASKLILKQHIVEFRHNLNFMYLQQRDKVFNDIGLEVNKINVDNAKIEVINSSKYIQFFAHHQKYGVIAENISNFDEYIEIVTKVCNHLFRSFEIKFFTRLGNRFQYLYPFETNFEELNDLFLENILRKKILNSFGSILDSGVTALTVEDETYSYNINLGPMKKEETSNFAIFKNYPNDPEIFLLIDIDTYQKIDDRTKPKDNILFNFLTESTDTANKKVVKFLNSLLGDKNGSK